MCKLFKVQNKIHIMFNEDMHEKLHFPPTA